MTNLNKIFNYLIVYYWLLIYIQTPNSGIGGNFLYILQTLPISGFIFYSILNIKDLSIPKELYWLILFVFASAYLSFIRSDFSGFISIMLFGLLIIVILKFDLSVNLTLINILFFISIFLSIPLYYTAYSKYGFFPGQANVVLSHDEFLAGRLSMFPNVTTSIYFSFMVFVLNYFFNPHLYKKLFIFFLSLYFIYFGISRTVLLVLLFVIYISFLIYKYPLKKNWLYQIILPVLLIGVPFIIIVFIDDIIYYLLSLHNDIISQYFFRGYDTVDKILDDIARTNIWSEHIRLFLEHPWGLSSAEIEKYVNPALHLSNGGGSESFLTRILMRYGFGSVFLYIFIFSILNRAIYEKNSYLYIFVYLFIFIGLTYGSFFTAYNILFLIFISSINIQEKNFEKKTFNNY